MAEAIKFWEALTGRRFDGNPETGLPWGMEGEEEDIPGAPLSSSSQGDEAAGK
ncbi:MAG TPA: hypothetical protein VJQ45_00600 [Ktedonobacterales bacterium]|nr:hypothetical protein [Ktedonobacterales bacterium]